MAQATIDLSGLTGRIDGIVAGSIEPVIKAIEPLIRANDTLSKANDALVKATETLIKANETMIKASASTISQVCNTGTKTDLSGVRSQILSNVRILAKQAGFTSDELDVIVYRKQESFQAEAVACTDYHNCGEGMVRGRVKDTVEEAMVDLLEATASILEKQYGDCMDGEVAYKQ